MVDAPQLRHDAGHVRAGHSEDLFELLGTEVAEEGPQDLHPRPVGWRAASLPAASPGDPHIPGSGFLGEGLRQARLADPDLPGHDDEAPLA